MKQEFETYEEVCRYLLNKFASEFGLSHVEGAQVVKGQRSGTSWKLDAKGVKKDGEGIVIVECRRHTTSRLNQEAVAGVAYRIIDTGAAGGITVSPLELQRGAKLVAAAEKIIEVHIDPNSDNEEYIMSFLNKVMMGVTETMPTFNDDSLSVRIVYADGRTENIDLS